MFSSRLRWTWTSPPASRASQFLLASSPAACQPRHRPPHNRLFCGRLGTRCGCTGIRVCTRSRQSVSQPHVAEEPIFCLVNLHICLLLRLLGSYQKLGVLCLCLVQVSAWIQSAAEGPNTSTMNIFRLAGDVSHVVAILILFLKIWRSRSCAGMSGRSIGWGSLSGHDHHNPLNVSSFI